MTKVIITIFFMIEKKRVYYSSYIDITLIHLSIYASLYNYYNRSNDE